MADEKKDETKPVEEAKKSETKPEADVESIVSKVRAEMEAAFKSEISGLNKKITELQTVSKQKETEKKTVEERLQAVEERERLKDSELSHERLIRMLQKEASERGLKLEDEIDIDNPALTLEKGIAFLDKRKAVYDERDKKLASDLIANNSAKPGSGAGKKQPIDLSKLSVEELAKLEEEGKLNEMII